jgi:hypothetical protein
MIILADTWASVGGILGIFGFAAAVFTLFQTRRTNELAHKANTLSTESNRIAKNANDSADSANRIAEKANKLAEEANETANKALKLEEDRDKVDVRYRLSFSYNTPAEYLSALVMTVANHSKTASVTVKAWGFFDSQSYHSAVRPTMDSSRFPTIEPNRSASFEFSVFEYADESWEPVMVARRPRLWIEFEDSLGKPVTVPLTADDESALQTFLAWVQSFREWRKRPHKKEAEDWIPPKIVK